MKAGENEWTTFDVVFLPRVSGAVQDTLYIHTSHGTFDFKVVGVVYVMYISCEMKKEGRKKQARLCIKQQSKASRQSLSLLHLSLTCVYTCS